MGLSIRAYAKHRGVSHVAVLRVAKAGRITLEPDGTVDPVKADAQWARSTEPERAQTTAEKLRPIAEAAVGSVRETLKEQGLPAGSNVTFVQARTAHEIAKAHLSPAAHDIMLALLPYVLACLATIVPAPGLHHQDADCESMA